MVKHKLICLLSALAIVLNAGIFFVTPNAVYADGEQTQNEEAIVINDADTLYAALYWGGNYVLGADIDSADLDPTYGSSFFVFADTNLDLGDYTITLSDSTSSIYTYNGNLTLNGGQGKIVKAIDNTDYPTVWVYGGDMIFEGGSIEGKKYPVMVSEPRQFTMNGGSITGETFGVTGYGASTIVVNDGVIDAGEIGLLGRGTDTGTKLTLNGGTINSDDTGIYSPQIDGVTTISGGVINAALNGVEVRAGTLSITGGEINVPSDVEYKVIPNGSGTTTTGAAVSVAQHTTKQPIDVTISGGQFNAPVAFSEANPQENSDEDIAKVTVAITGGIFAGEVRTEDLEDFIVGGTFSTPPAADEIIGGHEAEQEDELWTIVPIKVDWAESGYIESDSEAENQASATVEFGKSLMADRKATLSATPIDNTDGFSLTGAGELIGVIEVDMLDREHETIEVKDNNLVVRFDVDEETHDMLASYDELFMVYFEGGVEKERYPVVLENDCIWFETTHLSTYGLVGVNHEAGDEEESAPSSGVAAPDSGTMTIAGSSAMVSSIITSIVVGILVSITSFAYLIRRK